MGHTKSKEEVAMMNLFGYIAPQSIRSAYLAFTALSKEGNPRGQLGLGLMHAIGLEVNASVPHALTYLTFSAIGGDSLAEMALVNYFQKT
ncbi:unnamed protein product [Protopolystoma xenopodis]|uniref:Uncharacterized protein n=1 Tax=Protopolystoma xenopodis TaxID=117903 RepID=A0A3S5AN34_9PLAT|nr:unnamed protein product [Protopolystoma xenopodis]